MKAYISPLLRPDRDPNMLEKMEHQPIYRCPRCKVAFLMIDLASANLIRSKAIHSPNRSLHVSLRFWNCISCRGSLYLGKVGLSDWQNEPLRAHVEMALESLFGRLRAELPPERLISRFIHETEDLLCQLERAA